MAIMINNIFIKYSSNIKQAIKKLNNTKSKALIVIDTKNNYLGTITDGDVRRGLIKGLNLEHDVTKYINLDADKIWHLACPASPIHYQFDPINTSKTIFLGTLNMLELAENLKAKILLASSSEIYGNPEVNPQSEDYFGHLNP